VSIDGRTRGTDADLSFTAGGGQTGALIRSVDWRAMPLGPVAGWPQSLRTAVGICVSSRFPIAIYWGPELLMLYNDALLPMVGANKHPGSFGRSAFEVFPEIRGQIEPLLTHVLAGGEAILSEDMMLPLLRLEVPEESYFTFTYSAIPVESGDVGGVFCAAVETTDKVIEGRRLRLLNALAEVYQAKTPAETCALAAERIARDREDVPFALLYLLDASSRTAKLAGAANIEPGTPRSPISIAFGDLSVWPFDERTAGAPRSVPLEAGPAGSRGAVILPIERAGDGSPLGFMVAGLSAQLRDAPSYDLFHRLLAAVVSRAVSNAAASEARVRASLDMERALARAETSEARFFSFLMQAPAPMCILEGPQHRYTFANPMFTRLVGRADLIGKSVAEAFPELLDQGYLGILDSVFMTGRTYRGDEVPIRFERRADGQLEDGFVSFVYEPFRDLDGRVLGVLVVAFDVTEVVAARRASEREHAIERRARGFAELGAQIGRAFVGSEPLSDQLRRCCAALVSMGAAFARIWTYNANHEALELQASAGMYTHINGAHARVPLGSLKIGRIASTRTPHLTNAVVGDPHVADQAWAEREGLVAFAGYPLIVGERLVGVVALFAKQELSEDTLTALSSVADQIALGIDRDASERFRELFIGMLGHDLRNPLNAVTMATHLLASKVPEPLRATVARIRNSTTRMERMIAQVLDFTRARSGGGISLARTSADLAAITLQVIDELGLSHPGRSIRMTCTANAEGRWDTDRLAQVFSNLIANALTYGKNDAPVHVSISAADDALRWTVLNEGDPIQPELLPNLFDPFRRARHAKVGGTQGLGLGLFISKEIVKAHGGAIVVESTEAGTLFAVILPRSSP
jgi:signal transduction histidine kinase/PAS domain-containing protein